MNKKIELIEFDGKFWEKVEFRPPNAGEVFLCDICKRVHSTEFCWISVKVWILREVSAPPQPPAPIEKRLQSVCAKLSGEELLRKMLWRVPILTLDHDGEAEVLRRLKAYTTLLDGLRSIAETLDKMAPCPEEVLDQLLAEVQSLMKANE